VSKNCLPEWIYYYFKTGNRYLELEKIARGVGSKRIHSEQLSEIEIPLPDIPTQKKIINELKKDELKHSKLKSEISHQQSLLKKLRQAILQEAVQGKLVKQDKNDEPASELLKRIKAEKQKLIVEGKLRKEKPLPPIKEEEIPFALPKGWAWCRFGDISSVVRGGSPRPAGSKQFYDGNIPFLKVGDLTADEKIYLDTHTFTIKEAGLTKTRMVQENTLMLTNSGATLGVPKICRFKTTFNDGIAAFLNIDTRLSKEFLYFLLKSKTGWYLKEASRGQGQPNLNTDIIKNTLIAFPPSDEQLRIVGKINSLFLFCDQLEKQIEENVKHSEFLLQAVLKEAFEGKE
jgi:type I restriction enzyme S subunit